jgi:23S rRNA (cytidine2498-2'-O)-methyltransferase
MVAVSALNALLYCRPGFEKELAAEVKDAATALGVFGYAKAKPDSGHVLFAPSDPSQLDPLILGLRLDQLIFARQLLFCSGLVAALPQGDRVSPLLTAAQLLGPRFSDVIVEAPDTSEGKELQTLCRKLTSPFAAAARRVHLFGAEAGLSRLHVMLLSSSAGYVGFSDPTSASPWPMGIPRLKFPPGAPSRSTLKLAEAIVTFIPEDAERRRRLRAGMRGVDLGASPGGWTYQLVDRGIHVTAVDNGAIAPSLMATGLVDHLREDGFRFRPKRSVDWLVCDMVEQPSRVAALVGEWLSAGLAREAIFNLKLPMKRRLEEVRRCRDILREAMRGERHELRLKQLYHDREEVTGYLRRS